MATRGGGGLAWRVTGPALGARESEGCGVRGREEGSVRDATCRGVGIGFRAQLATALLHGSLRADFLEVVAEGCQHSPALDEVAALGRTWPLALHGVKQSLGSASGPDLPRMRRLAHLARRLGAAVVSEHICFTRAGGCEIGHLTPLPHTEEAVLAVASQARQLQAMLDVPLLLENVARTFAWPEDVLTEAEFITCVVKASGCDLLLDVSNLYANAVNAGLDPRAVLDAYPLDRVRMAHVAGGIVRDGFYYDTHAHSIPAAVFDLLRHLRARIGEVPLLFERDGGLDALSDLGCELTQLRAIMAGETASGGASGESGQRDAARGETASGGALPRVPSKEAMRASLAVRQDALARVLTAPEFEPHRLADLDLVALQRTRDVLRRKRLEEALPLLGTLGRLVSDGVAMAEEVLSERPRFSQYNAFADAWAIARRAQEVPELSSAAVAALLRLEARFVNLATRPRPRWGPFLARRVNGDETLWMFKGLGPQAAIRTWRR